MLINLVGKRVTLFTSIVFAIISIIGFEWNINLPWGIDENLTYYIPYIAMGNVYAELNLYEKIKDNKRYVNYILIIALFGINILSVQNGNSTYANKYFSAVTGIVLWCLVSICLEEKSRIIIKLGSASLFCLGLQNPIYDVFSKIYCVLFNISREECMKNEAHAFVCCLVTIIVCYSIYVTDKQVRNLIKAKKWNRI